MISVEVSAARSLEENRAAQVCAFEEACEDATGIECSPGRLNETEAARVHFGANERGVHQARFIEPCVVERGVMAGQATQIRFPQIGAAERYLVELAENNERPSQIAVREV